MVLASPDFISGYEIIISFWENEIPESVFG